MPERTYEFVQVDVFTQTPLTGNPLAIFTDARGLNDDEMLALAREMNLSETTFIFPRDPATEAHKVRIFTVAEELPFAGHPTLGTALHLYASGFSPVSEQSTEITLDLKAGKIPVRFTANSENAGRNRVDGQVFGEMRQRDPEFGVTFSREEVARVIGLAADEIPPEWPIEIVSTGLPFAIVGIRSQETLTNLKFDNAQAADFLKNSDAKFFYFVCPQRREGRLEAKARMFSYGVEDPATGSAAGCAASWMAQHGIANSDEQVLIRQGVEIRRPSEIHVRATRDGERVTNVRVGGYAVEVLRGTVTIKRVASDMWLARRGRDTAAPARWSRGQSVFHSISNAVSLADMERRLTAILAADVVGYSRMMGANEAGTLEALKAVRVDFVDGSITQYQGRVVNLTGDGMLVEFPSVVNAVGCAAEIQRGMRDRNVDLPPDRRIEFRIGVNLGDVIVEGDDIYGDGVNVAVRLESIAEPGGISVSHSVRDQVGNRLDLTFEDKGEQNLKNIEKPIRVYNVSLDGPGARSEKQRRPEKPSIAVMPFANMSGDPDQDYFSDGITEDIITDLSKISGLFVVARHSAFIYKDKPVKAQQIGQELGVDFLLEGSVRKAGSHVRVTGQLVNSKDGGHLWAERFDRDLTDIFAIQDEITHAIVEQLKVKLLPQEKKSIEQAPTDNVEAYTYYLRGRQFLHRHSKSYYDLARRMFTKAVELDPRYARAYAGIADCDSFLRLHYHVGAAVQQIFEMTDKALSLDDQLAEAHASRGLALSIEKRFEESTAEFEKAIALDPNSFEAHYLYARGSFAQGKLERAAELFERAAAISPEDYQSLVLLIQIYRSLGRDAEKDVAARRAIERAERELILHPEDPRPAYMGIAALIEMREGTRAREWIERALVIGADDPLTQYNLACGYTKLGDTEQALDLLERMLPNVGAEIRMWIKHDSDFDALRNNPRFQKLLEANT